jgi:hypothetical protein
MAIKKQSKASMAKPKTAKSIKVKPTPKPAAKKTKPVSAPVAEPSPKAEKPAKVYKPRKAASGLSSYADLLKKQSELETIKKQAKAELRKAYEDKVKEADGIKKQYSSLFDESIDSLPKIKKARQVGVKRGAAKKGAAAPYTAAEIDSFIEQKEQGIDAQKIKLSGRRIKSIRKIDEAYERSDAKDADSLLELLQ